MNRAWWSGTGAIIIIIAVVIALLCISKYNTISELDEKVETTWSPLVSVMQKRYDIVPKLVSAVVRYTGKRDDAVKTLTATYDRWKAEKGIPDRVEAASAIEAAYTQLFIEAGQRYPGISSNYQIVNLRTAFDQTEGPLLTNAGSYNNTVESYNTYSRKFPNNIVALILGFYMKYPYFKREAS